MNRAYNEKTVVVPKTENNDRQKASRNLEYLAKLDRSFEQMERGEVITKSFNELEEMSR
ncbi:MAG: hypothetical protein LUI13_05870 [Lachnospiraceae bacterium]|nr:hypothetical protein [Lachnospiraceae bacterium]